MKVGHFNTAFRASLLLFVSLCSSVALSDGYCYLDQSPNGQYVIRCEGDGLWFNYVDKTNEVYIIQNCELLKSQLVFAVDSISASLMDSRTNYLHSAIGSLLGAESLVNSLDGDSKSDAVSAVQSARSDLLNMDSSLDRVDDSLSSLRSDILSIECGSCSSDSGGDSCCGVDLTPILEQLNIFNFAISSITNALLGTYNQMLQIPYLRANVSLTGSYFVMSERMWRYGNSSSDFNILNILRTLDHNVSYALSSLNNYFNKLVEHQLPNISNNLEIVMSTTTNFYNAATNHFSFFRDMTFQDSPLIDYSQQSTFDSYYDFLTNHYVKVSFKQYNDLVGDEKSKTNWFSRIEALLAALVFNDVEGTNTVDDTFGQSQQNNLINSLDGMNQTSTTQVNLMSNMGDSLLASLRSLNSSFSSAVSMPGEVKLATISHDNGMVTQTIKFQSSEISQLVEACRCATTLAWCFGGIWLLFLFVSWSVKTSYSLCVFCWSVVSAIFGGGKT